jgi:hypothetical protein
VEAEGVSRVSGPRDHYVPRTYLRGFTAEYLLGKSGETLFYFHPGLTAFPTARIEKLVACEPDFYSRHPIDKHWAQTIENEWPRLRDRVSAKDRSHATRDLLFWFTAAQLLRTPAYLKQVANRLSFSAARTITTVLDGRPVKGKFIDMAKTFDCVEVIAKQWPVVRAQLEQDFRWSIYHTPNSTADYFITSDNPCTIDKRGNLRMPISLKMALKGEPIRPGESANFRHRTATREIVYEVNKTTIAGCTSYVFAHEGTPAMLKVVRKHWVESDPATLGRGFTNDPEPMTDERIETIMLRFNQLRAKER